MVKKDQLVSGMYLMSGRPSANAITASELTADVHATIGRATHSPISTPSPDLRT